MTHKQRKVYEALTHLANRGVEPTVRSLADRMEERGHRKERWSSDEVRGLLERLEADGLVEQFSGQQGEQRYRPINEEDGTNVA